MAVTCVVFNPDPLIWLVNIGPTLELSSYVLENWLFNTQVSQEYCKLIG